MVSNKQSGKCPTIYHIGVPRTGTTTLQSVLTDDPRINMSQERYFQTAAWFSGRPPFKISSDQLNVHSDETMMRQHGHYFNMAITLERMSRVVPDAQIIITIREQKSWLLSAYKRGVEFGYVYESFEKWLTSRAGVDFLSLGNYDVLYRTVREFFPEKNIHILLVEHLKDDFTGFFTNLYEIFGIPFHGADLRIVNRSRPDRVLQWKRIFNRFAPIPDQAFKFASIFARGQNQIYKLLTRCLGFISSMLPESKRSIMWHGTEEFKAIEEEYKRSNRNLKELTGIDLEKHGYL